MNGPILPIDETLTSTTDLSQSGPGSNGNEVRYSPKIQD